MSVQYVQRLEVEVVNTVAVETLGCKLNQAESDALYAPGNPYDRMLSRKVVPTR